MKYTIGVDLGGTRIKIGLVNQGELIDAEIIDAHSGSGLSSQLPNLEQFIRKLCAKHNVNTHQLCGIGVAFPGIVDSRQMRIISTNVKYPDAPEIDLNKWVNDKFNTPFAMDNDARLALIGEWQYGAGIGVDDLIMMTLGTGIGGAALIEGKVLRGKHFIAGCLGGHMTLNMHGNPCQCGNIGCVEAEASTWRLPQMARESKGFESSRLSQIEKIDYEHVFNMANDGDALAMELKDKSVRTWAFGMVNMIHAYDPDRVIVSGGIIKHNENILPRFQEIINKHTWSPWGKAQVVKANWPEYNAILGCEYLLNQI